jgi:pyruvate/2-oxoglutarate dehydrogenase complex dihydrolipoamide dehydrogenase (E3) component
MVTTARITGNIAAMNLVKGKVIPYRGTTMTFIMDVSGYEVGAVGFTEEKAKKMGLYATSVSYKALKTRPAYGGKPVYCKLIGDRKTQTLLGGQVVSQHEIGAMINELAVVFAEGVPLPDILRIDTPYSPLIGPDPVRGAMALLLTKLDKA